MYINNLQLYESGEEANSKKVKQEQNGNQLLVPEANVQRISQDNNECNANITLITQGIMQTAQVSYENKGIFHISGPNPDTPCTATDE